jgi:GNAT superfamily N-acetyltransferase
VIRCRAMRDEERGVVLDLVMRVFDGSVRPDFSDAGVAEFVRAARSMVLERPEGHRVAVAEEDGRICGMADVREGPHISLFFVDTAFQRRGIGRALLDHVLSALDDVPQERGPVLTVNSSPGAVPAYEHLGFTRVSRELEQNGIRFVRMERPL